MSDEWINYFRQSWETLQLSILDFRLTGTFALQALASLCELVDQTVSNNLKRFYAGQYVRTEVTPMLVF